MYEFSSTGLFICTGPVMDIKYYIFFTIEVCLNRSSIGHGIYEISSNGLFMVLVQYWTWNI